MGFRLSKRQSRSTHRERPRIESYAWVPKSWSFVKLYEVENFPTWVIFSLKAINRKTTTNIRRVNELSARPSDFGVSQHGI